MPQELPPFLTYLSVLGHGGMGAVLKAFDTRWGLEVAVKVLPVACDPEFAQRQRHEAEALAALSHPNVVSLIESFEWEGQHFLLIELLEGGDIAELLQGTLSLSRILEIFAQVCLGLQYIHDQGLVHRDIKPGNILFSQDGVAKIADLGLVRRQGQQSGLTEPGVMMGTAAYVSPEQIRSTREVGPPGDLYSLGCTLFHALTGQWPFPGKNEFEIMQAHLAQPPPRLRDLRPNLPRELDAVMARLLDKTPDLRPPASQVREVLLRILDPPAVDLTLPTASTPEQLPAGPLQVLLVDADPATQALVNGVLAGRGHDVIIASDGATAIDMCALMDFDLMLIDLEVPGMSGAEVASLLRAQGHRAPIMALTAGKREAALRPCLKAGMNALLSKPLQEPELLSTLAQVLGA